MRKSILSVIVLSALSSAAFAQSDFVGSGQYREDQAKQSTRDAGQDAAIHQVHMNMLGKYSESYGLEDRANIAGLQESKVDKSVFEADQARQDKQVAGNYKELQAEGNLRRASDEALKRNIDANNAAQTEHVNAVQSAAQSANEKADAGAVRADGIEKNLANTDNRSINNAVRLDGAEAGIRETNSQVEANRKAGEATDKGLSARIDTKVDNGVFTHRSAVVDSRFADTQQRIDTNKAEQAKVNKAVANTLDNHEGRISSLESQTSSKFASMDKRIDSVRDEANAGTASAISQANIPQVMAEGEFGIGAGAGTYAGQNAVAVGASYAPRENLVFKATVSTDSQHNFGAGAGIMVSFH